MSSWLVVTGTLTLLYFVLAARALSDDADRSQLAVLWTVTFLLCTTFYRPTELLLARTVAARLAAGRAVRFRDLAPVWWVHATAVGLLVALLTVSGPTLSQELWAGQPQATVVLWATVLAYAVSYPLRGYLAGQHRVGLFGAVIVTESAVRCIFPAAVHLGVVDGAVWVFAGLVAAPVVSILVVILWWIRQRVSGFAPSAAPSTQPDQVGPVLTTALSYGAAARFAVGVAGVLVCEQVLLSGGVLVIAADRGSSLIEALAGGAGVLAAVFHAFLIARAPTQVFQAIQNSLLPHLARLRVHGDSRRASRAVGGTLLVVAGSAVSAAAVLATVGPWVMSVIFPSPAWSYSGLSLGLLGLGAGLHLSGGTLTQSAWAHDGANRAWGGWLAAAAACLAGLDICRGTEPVLRAAVSYAAGALVLTVLLAVSTWSGLRRPTGPSGRTEGA